METEDRFSEMRKLVDDPKYGIIIVLLKRKMVQSSKVERQIKNIDCEMRTVAHYSKKYIHVIVWIVQKQKNSHAMRTVVQ